jgi:hypothetical protein
MTNKLSYSIGIVATGFALFSSASSAANALPVDFHLVTQASTEYGGDPFIEVKNGSATSTYLQAGHALGAAIGISVTPKIQSSYDIRLTVGYKYNKEDIEDIAGVSASYKRIPIELIATYHTEDNIRLGFGPVFHTGVKVSSDGVPPEYGIPSEYSLDNALGGKVEFGWKWVAATYTRIKYTYSYDGGSTDFRGDAFGLMLIGEFF